MNEQETKEFTVRIIREECATRGIEIKKIILFGSHARGDANPDSDWDFLLVTENELSHKEKMEIRLYSARKLAREDISADLIIKDETTFNRQLENVGVITYYAVREGVSV